MGWIVGREGMDGMGWKDGRMEGWKDGRMEGWIDGNGIGWERALRCIVMDGIPAGSGQRTGEIDGVMKMSGDRIGR